MGRSLTPIVELGVSEAYEILVGRFGARPPSARRGRWRNGGHRTIRWREVSGMHKDSAYITNGKNGTGHGTGLVPPFGFCKGISKTGLDWSILKGDVKGCTKRENSPIIPHEDQTIAGQT